MFEFQKLEVYRKAKEFNRQISKLLFEIKVKRIVNDQLSRAALSIPLNIAEGSGRFSKPDRRNFFVISRSSVFECVAILDILKDQDIVTEETFQNLSSMADELSRILFTMIRNLELQKG